LLSISPCYDWLAFWLGWHHSSAVWNLLHFVLALGEGSLRCYILQLNNCGILTKFRYQCEFLSTISLLLHLVEEIMRQHAHSPMLVGMPKLLYFTILFWMRESYITSLYKIKISTIGSCQSQIDEARRR